MTNHEQRDGHGHGHGQAHGHTHACGRGAAGVEPDWDALAAHLEREGELHAPAFTRAAGWLHELRGGAVVERVLDVGSGPGVVAGLLADAFPGAEVVAVDRSAALLERARARSSGRVATRQADLPADFGLLGAADLIWSSQAVHHLGDQQAALTALAGSLRPGGLLAVAERGLPLRFLPRDIGLGRPGLQARLDAAHEDAFSLMRAELPDTTPVVEDWPAMLAEAGLVPAGSRTFLAEWPAPLDRQAREHLHGHLLRRRDQLTGQLDAEDLATLDALLDPDAPAGILARPDAFFLVAVTVHTARAGEAS
ncbi:class I SAM-dependent methyltransferase [Kitasatospora sp. CM 4170]|uniref:Class I SAM-dependent methyltransferase n=1 Tax=Kitasatospora aburaviensis TaxID=67265 RepID=A0ABW1F121_9ACTN|nr:class I SAM-dependent methyltransferase [Kitasatospora sp. CM 4170]WNM47047.1 class I SAM-dependent methyltransferase [Kitasatospora sp. CM 4170]